MSSSISPVSLDESEQRPRSEHRWFFLFSHPSAGRIVALVAIAVTMTSVVVGFTADDYGFRTALETGLRPSFDLFRFGSGSTTENLHLIAEGTFPWWMAPDFKLHFIRPLTSLLFTLDFDVFGSYALGYHLTSIALYLALLLAVSQILRRTLHQATATLAVLVFALRSAHVLPYAWICAQHMLVGVVPAMFGLLAHIRARSEGWRYGRFLAPLLFGVGLAGSEMALSVVPLWIAFSFVHARPTRAWRDAFRSCTPLGVMVVLYLVVYRLVGGGTHSANGYLDPMAEPMRVARAAARRVPTLLGDALLAFPAARSGGLLHVVLGIAGVVLCGALLVTCRSVDAKERAALTWLVPGALLGVALGGTSGTARLLLIPDLGFSALLAVLIRHGFERAGASYASWTARVTATAGLVLAHLVLAPIASLAQIQGLARGARADEAIAANAELGVTPAQRVLVVASSEPEVFFYPKEILADKAAGLVRCWSVLSAAAAPHRLTRTGEHSFTLEVTGRTDDEDGYEDQYFASRRFVAGDQVRQCGASIRIDAVDEGRPSKLSVELDEPLDSADLTFLSWEDGRLRHVRVPGLGEIADFPWSPVSGPSHASRVRALARAVWRTVRRQL